MKTEIIELRMAMRALPTENKLVNLCVKAEINRLTELLNKPTQSEENKNADTSV